MLAQLTDRATPFTGTIDTVVIDRALADADAEINGYLAGRYQLPLATAPELLTDFALRITIYKLHTKVAPERITQDYELARADLLRVSRGDIVLQVAGVAAPAGTSQEVLVTDANRPLTAHNMGGFI